MKTFFIRSISGILYAAIIFGSILSGPEIFAALLLFVQIAGLYELEQLAKKSGTSFHRSLFYIIPVIFFILGILLILSLLPMYYATLLLPLLFLSGILHLILSPDKPLMKIGTSLFSLFYLTGPLLCLMLIRFVSSNTGPADQILVLALFVLIWINDTFAYMVGSSMGKHALVGRLSPKKTWEGAIGGLLFSLIAAYFISVYVDLLNVWQWMGFALLVVFAGTFGDLFESMLKRDAGIKESGRLIPGHGGILDRFDSVLVAAPFIFVYLYLMFAG